MLVRIEWLVHSYPPNKFILIFYNILYLFAIAYASVKLFLAQTTICCGCVKYIVEYSRNYNKKQIFLKIFQKKVDFS